jgi:phenylacetate-CoA ligase
LSDCGGEALTNSERQNTVSSNDLKTSNSRSHVWPAVRLGLAAEISALFAELNETQWLSRTTIETRQMQQFRKLLQFVIEHSPFYARRFASSGARLSDFQTIDSLRNLSVLARQDLQSAGDEFFCQDMPADQGEIGVTQTSGSTGETVRVRKTGITQLFWHTYTLRNCAWHQIPFDARYTIIRPNVDAYSEQPNWGAPFAFLFKTGPTQIIPIITPLAEQVELLRKFQPETLLINPSNLRGLIDLWGDEGSGLSKLTFIKSIGETLQEDLRQAVAELDAGISVIDGYSSQECGAIAMQCPDGGGYHVMSESLIVEILDQDGEPCAPGQIGRIVVTDLHNLASPIIRYDIGDYAQLGETCSCGRGLTKLDKILGRTRNLVVKPNGDRHWPLVGFHSFDTIAPIRQYQLIQETVERITVRFVTDEPLTPDQKAAFTVLLQKALGYEFEMDILDQRDKLPLQPGGKFEEFISKVS